MTIFPYSSGKIRGLLKANHQGPIREIWNYLNLCLRNEKSVNGRWLVSSCWRYAPKSTKTLPPNLDLLCRNVIKTIPGLRSLHIDLIGSGKSLSTLVYYIPILIYELKVLKQFSSTYQYCTSLNNLRDPLDLCAKLKVRDMSLLLVGTFMKPSFEDIHSLGAHQNAELETCLWRWAVQALPISLC